MRIVKACLVFELNRIVLYCIVLYCIVLYFIEGLNVPRCRLAEFQSALFFRQYFRATEPPVIVGVYFVYIPFHIIYTCIYTKCMYGERESCVQRYAHPTYIIAFFERPMSFPLIMYNLFYMYIIRP